MTIILNKSYQSNPLAVNQGGSGVSVNTAYSLLAGGTSSTLPIQQAGTGTSGQLYASGGSASLGSYVDSKSNTCFQLITTLTASASSSITFSGLSSTYFAYKIVIDAVLPTTTANTFRAQLNGITANYQYAGYSISTVSAQTAINSNSASSIFLTSSGGLSSASTRTNNFEVTLINPAGSIGAYPIIAQGKFADSIIWMGGWYTNDTNAITSIAFSMASSTIASGTFKLYAILA